MKLIKEYKPQDICRDKQHNPPSAIVLKPGLYEHTCPSCGKTVKISIPRISC
jgi:hypothetical protein